MSNTEINHAASLIPALQRKAQLLRQQADDLDSDKEGRSLLAVSLRQKAASLDQQVHDLKAAVDAARWLG